MKNAKNTVMGVHAPPPRPDGRGFFILACLLGLPFGAALWLLQYLFGS